MIDLKDTTALNSELESAIINMASYHNKMQEYYGFYRHSAFYPRKSGTPSGDNKLYINLLKVFADKNIHYTSRFPLIKVLTTGSDPVSRKNASIREKILNAVHQKSGTALLQSLWAKDSTLRTVAISEVVFDIRERCAKVQRYNPRRVFWQMSNGNDSKMLAFWAVYPITSEECKDMFGKVPKGSGSLSSAVMDDDYLAKLDGRNWHIMAIRWDDKTRVKWCGDQMLEEPHNHNMGGIPIDMAMPFGMDDEDGETRNSGAFFLEDLVPLQAELNDAIRTRSSIARRMGRPTIWGRGIMRTGMDDVKQQLSNGSGFVGLKRDGELGLLQVQESRLINEHIADLIGQMMRISGFSSAAFGESVGANTSGDAIGMHFTPTQRLIDHQNIAWVEFYKNINAKILKAYDRFGKIGETFSLTGYSPKGTIQSSEEGSLEYGGSGSYSVTFTKDQIAGMYDSVVVPADPLPKNEIAEKQFWRDSAKQGVVSRTTAYEKMGIESPEDELEMLKAEQMEPSINPDGTQKIMQSATQFAQAQMQPQPSVPQIPASMPVGA